MNHSAVRALIVDDEPHVRQYLALILQSLGIVDCAQAGNIDEARAAHAAEPAEFLLLDINLPGASGMEWLRELRAAGDDAVVVLISSQANAAFVLESAELGADGYLRKDMMREELAAELGRIVADTLGD